jgi:hypothetical protein
MRRRNTNGGETTSATGPLIAKVKKLNEEPNKGGRSGKPHEQSAGSPELQAVLPQCVVMSHSSLSITWAKLVDQERWAVTNQASPLRF